MKEIDAAFYMEVSSKTGEQIDTVNMKVFSCLRRELVFFTKNL